MHAAGCIVDKVNSLGSLPNFLYNRLIQFGEDSEIIGKMGGWGGRRGVFKGLRDFYLNRVEFAEQPKALLI